MNPPVVVPEIQVKRVSPFDPETAGYTPELHQRMLKLAKDSGVRKFDALVQYWWTRTVAEDSGLAIVGAFRGPMLVGHAVGDIMLIDQEKVVYVEQCTSDHPEALAKMLDWADNWAKEMYADLIRISVVSERSEEVWKRIYGKYDFKIVSRVLEREVK
jgi:hypothetical protein